MRLSEIEKRAIIESIRLFDPNCKIFLYGSRVNQYLKGGDIDLLVLSESMGFSEKISALVEIKKKIGEQKIDLMIKKSSETASDPFVQSIIGSAIRIEEQTPQV